jgi:Cu2+-containing amine oxidase
MLHQDGSIQHQVQMTGMLSINVIAKGAYPAGYGTIVFPRSTLSITNTCSLPVWFLM